MIREIMVLLLMLNIFLSPQPYRVAPYTPVPVERGCDLDIVPLAVYIMNANPKVAANSHNIARTLLGVEEALELPPLLLAAIAHTESHFDHEVVGAAGEVGMLQLHPKYHRAGETFEEHVLIAGQYLKSMLDKFGDVRLAVAAYNQGPGNPQPDTRYVRLVMHTWNRIKEEVK